MDTCIGFLLDLQLIKIHDIRFDEGLRVGEDTLFSILYTLYCDVNKRIRMKEATYGYRKFNSTSLSYGEWRNPQKGISREYALLKAVYKCYFPEMTSKQVAVYLSFIRKKKNVVKSLLVENKGAVVLEDISLLRKKASLQTVIKADGQLCNKAIELLFLLPFAESVCVFNCLYNVKRILRKR